MRAQRDEELLIQRFGNEKECWAWRSTASLLVRHQKQLWQRGEVVHDVGGAADVGG